MCRGHKTNQSLDYRGRINPSTPHGPSSSGKMQQNDSESAIKGTNTHGSTDPTRNDSLRDEALPKTAEVYSKGDFQNHMQGILEYNQGSISWFSKRKTLVNPALLIKNFGEVGLPLSTRDAEALSKCLRSTFADRFHVEEGISTTQPRCYTLTS